MFLPYGIPFVLVVSYVVFLFGILPGCGVMGDPRPYVETLKDKEFKQVETGEGGSKDKAESKVKSE